MACPAANFRCCLATPLRSHTLMSMNEFLTQPGESLLGAVPTQEASTRFREFTELTGIPSEFVSVSFLVGIPLPVYPSQWEPGLKRWRGTKPEAMTNPLMWLPAHLSGRYTLVDAEGNEELETEDEWAVRVCNTLMDSGFYDAGHIPEAVESPLPYRAGGWVDVLAEHGLDIHDPAVYDRVAAWLHGAEDDVLDSIDLTDAMTPAVPEGEDPAAVSVLMAAMLIYDDHDNRTGDGFLRHLQWATHAEDIAEWATGMQQADQIPADDVLVEYDAMRDLAASVFEQLPDFPAHLHQWDTAREQWDGFEESLRHTLLGNVIRSMTDIHAFYGAQVEQVLKEDDEDFGFED